MTAELDPTSAPPDPPTRVPLAIERVLIAAAMAAVALITAANVAVRYLSDVSLAFTEEYSVALMVIVTLLGTSLATAAGRHIRIGYFAELLPPRAWRWAEIATLVLVVLMFGILAAWGASLTWDEYRFEIMSAGLDLPQWWYTGWLPLLSLVVIGRAVGRMLRLARGGAG